MVADLKEDSEERSPDAALTPQETGRLCLDMPRNDDLADIVYLANNRKIASMLATMPHPFGLDDAREMVARSQSNGPRWAKFAVRLKSTGRFIGAAGFGAFEETGEYHLGYWIGEPFQGKGYATEAAQTLIDHVFTKTPVSRLEGAIRIVNPSSRRVLVKCGFQYRDQSMIQSRAAGGAVSVERFYLERSTWEALKKWARAS
ncbi:GNAT family N-acetyltransferase [Stappia sp. GBMRC 2046]|uniref:GNAT family N-acetyltransferase n=1 Tax=Stappia sediminis TaxID=2692190 RepID=A0A7X3LX52_9HYPH|nr:GNAT family N-acetyltransferase [Stappia sediminis]MXN66685.1 GNAT family N-acetyltransferase [Stappia sediminis]